MKSASSARLSPDRYRLLAILLYATTAAWTLAMLASLRWRFLDRFVTGANHGLIGNDFFSLPRGFLNLLHGSNIFLTDMSDFGPYGMRTSPYLSHPFLVVASGWTALLSPWVAFGAFVGVSLVLLFVAAMYLSSQFETPIHKAFTYFAFFCTLPTYIMLWNAQVQVFAVLAVSLILAGLIRLNREQAPSKAGLFWIQAGILISLLSKPVVLLALPALFCLRETRRSLVTPILIYVVISIGFLVVPVLNRGGFNGVHWMNLIHGTSATSQIFASVMHYPAQRAHDPEIYSLPMTLARLRRLEMKPGVIKIPIVVTLGMALAPLLLAERSVQVRVAIIAVCLVVLNHFLTFYIVWEYHYTLLLPVIPVVFWLFQNERAKWLRGLLLSIFVASLLEFLPTPYFLSPNDPGRFQIIGAFERLIPVGWAYAGLLIYAIALIRQSQLAAKITPVQMRGQIRELIPGGAFVTTAMGILVLCVCLTTPKRLWVASDKWTARDFATHYEAILRDPALPDPWAFTLHQELAEYYAPAKPDAAIGHYRAAIKLAPNAGKLRVALGDLLVRQKQYDAASDEYLLFLKANPDNQEVLSRLDQIKSNGS